MSLAFNHWRKLIDDPNALKRVTDRTKFISLVREFFVGKDFLEVETPLMVKQCGLEPNLTPFETDLIDRDGKHYARYLITSPEHHMKMLLCAGLKNIFQICKCFRNCEEGSDRHSPEFTMIEWYRTDADYFDIMDDMEKLFLFVCRGLHGSDSFEYQNMTVDFSKPWSRITVADAFEQYAGVKNLRDLSLEDFSEHALRLNLTVTDKDTWDDIFYKIFLTHIEKHLGQDVPTFLYDYPAHMAALAVKRGKVCERFEAYIHGIELCNAFSELNDAGEQRERFVEERQERASMGKNDLPLPEDFLRAMEVGMPKAAGNALGLDRMFMILMDRMNLKDVLPFADFWESGKL